MICPVCSAPQTRHLQRVDARDYWRCDTCQATCLDSSQLPDRDTEVAQYRSHENSVDDPAYRNFLSRLAEPLLDRLPPAARGLDYGCGPGPALAALLREAGHDVAIYDPLFFDDPEVLQRRYDFITCTEVVEHLHQPAREFARLNDLLCPGGWLGIMTLFQTDDAAFANWHYRRDPTHVVFYRPATFQHLAQLHSWRCEIPRDNVVLLHKPAVA